MSSRRPARATTSRWSSSACSDAAYAQPPGGAVTYLAEPADPAQRLASARPVGGTPRHRPASDAVGGPWRPTRSPRVGGGRAHRPRTAPVGPARQQRTWNLSSLWQIPTHSGDVWLKLVPPFFAHEGDVLELLQGEAVPPLISHTGQRMLLGEVDGEDLYDAAPEQLERLLDLLVDLQVRYSARCDELTATGMTDFRGANLTADIASVVERTADAPDQARALDPCRVRRRTARAFRRARLLRSPRDTRPRRLPSGQRARGRSRPDPAGLGRLRRGTSAARRARLPRPGRSRRPQRRPRRLASALADGPPRK